MRPLTAERPKGLVEVAGRPLLTHCFDALLDADVGVDELVVVVGYRGTEIRDHYGDAFEGTPITYVEQPEPRGLADAIGRAAPRIDGDFVHLNGDNVPRANLGELVERHRERGADATLLVESVSPERAREGGVLELDEDGSIAGLVEKPSEPPSTLIPRGCYAFSGRILSACEAVEPGHTGEYELSDAIDRIVGAGDAVVETVQLDGWVANVNTPADVAAVEKRLRQ
jgi:glucose-1-phosphate thymidylyltransferase